ncbi:MAG TPA: hypothetical protein PLA41_00750 [Candidatus Pacearchaeota archaeon]|nr:hypothetical protein [Candidatus Parcubacteria bacterium]HOU45665.1 hypothetical protein [Candidatus Pacearchaeota archaeon]HPM08273.1 hypothetical protein [Candidatus Pacearchaeota archaeon]HQI74594.1 hypothetical protein [Candidatus Pacearchaeota archaeon]
MDREKKEIMFTIFAGIIACVVIFLAYLIISEFLKPSLISVMMIGFTGILVNIVLFLFMNKIVFPNDSSRKI